MTNQERLFEIVLEQVNLHPDDINEFSSLSELVRDDEDYWEIIYAVKEEFDVLLDESVICDLTLQEICDIVEERNEA